MGSSEIVDSGRPSGGRSNFSQTCSLLSRYLKEKGSFGDLGLSLTHNVAPKGAPTETLNLLPMIENCGQMSDPGNLHMPPAMFPPQAAGRDETQKRSDLSVAKSEAKTAQMTIFYAGQVIVFNDFPANKAKEIMMLASNSRAAHGHPNAACALLDADQSPAESATSIPSVVPSFGVQKRPLHSVRPPLDSDLPIARKNSLARFLEKRKDRITANAPYPAGKPAAPPKTAKTEGWLGLYPQLPL